MYTINFDSILHAKRPYQNWTRIECEWRETEHFPFFGCVRRTARHRRRHHKTHTEILVRYPSIQRRYNTYNDSAFKTSERYQNRIAKNELSHKKKEKKKNVEQAYTEKRPNGKKQPRLRLRRRTLKEIKKRAPLGAEVCAHWT